MTTAPRNRRSSAGDYDRSPLPPHFKPSGKQEPGFRDALSRQSTAAAFVSGAELYDAVRPSYPPEVAQLVSSARTLIDVGAGTGKLTEGLASPGRIVYATDPSADMLRVLAAKLPEARVWQATAEATGLQDSSVDAYVSAQTWHWVDSATASAEAHRVVKPDGHLLLSWNTLDVSHPWVLRLSRITHSGDVLREGFYPTVERPWRLAEELRMKWFQPVTTHDLFALAQTRSYWLQAGEPTRRRVHDNLSWFLFDRLGLDEGQPVPLPYRTDAFLYARQ